jgi:plasmid maintenance system antidote protein VapI
MEPTTGRYRAPMLADVMRAQGRRNDWLASRAGISEALVTRLIKGERTVSGEVARRIAESLQLPVGLLFKLSDDGEALVSDTEQEAIPA